MVDWQKRLDQAWYPDYGDNWDDWLFARIVRNTVSDDSVVLDLGAGAGIIDAYDFRDSTAKVCGIDPDERVFTNPYLDEAKEGFGHSIPYPDDSFDAVICANVFEHFKAPRPVFSEVGRVLKPAGHFLAKTPNKKHYMSLISGMTPLWFHEFYNRLRGREEEDTFPAHYRANSPHQVQKLAERSGFKIRRLLLREGRPEYLRLNPLTYFVGYLYERLVNSTDALRHFRILLIAHLQLTESPQ